VSNKWPTQAECDTFYGNPRASNGGASAGWEFANLVHYTPPWQMIDEDTRKPISGIRLHRKCRDSFGRVFSKAWELYGKSQARNREAYLHLFSGSYVFRNIRGGSNLSMHSYGIAVDIAAGLNGLVSHVQPSSSTAHELDGQTATRIVWAYQARSARQRCPPRCRRNASKG